MKIRKLFLLPLSFMLLTMPLVGCGGGPNDPTPVDPEKAVTSIEISKLPDKLEFEVDETFTYDGLEINAVLKDGSKEAVTGFSVSTPDMTSIGEKTITVTYQEKTVTFVIEVVSKGVKLATPVLSLNENKDGLVWGRVEGAKKYSVLVNDGTPQEVSETSYSFATEPGTYTVKVKALAERAKYNSDEATYSYQTITPTVEGLTLKDGVITWDSAPGLGLEVTRNAGIFVKVEGNSYNVNGDGTYTFHSLAGYDEQNKIYYPETLEAYKSILVSTPNQNPLVLEDGSDETDSDLQEKYTALKYGDSGWVATPASVTLDTSNKGFTEGKCVQIKYWKHGVNFKFERKDMTFGAYDTVSFALKGTADNNEKFKVQFVINKNVMLAGLNLKGVYITYTIGDINPGWVKHTVSMSDPKWSIAMGDNTFTPTAAIEFLKTQGLQVKSLGDLLPYFDTFSVMASCSPDENWSTSYLWFDDLTLSNTGKDTSHEDMVMLGSKYAFKSDSLQGKLTKENSGWQLSFKMEGQPVSMPCTAEIVGSKLKVTSVVPEKDFVAFLTSQDSGNTFELESVSGSAGELLANLKVEQYASIDGFDYADSDQLKAAYYADNYTNKGEDSSTLGGPRWKEMSDEDCLVSVENGHEGRGATLKYNKDNQTRYTTSGLVDGTAISHGKMKKLSFWTKGLESRDSVIKVRIFTISHVTPATQQDTSKMMDAAFTIKAGAGWTECVVTLNNTITSVYGLSIIPLKGNGSGDLYVPFDDITMYNNISPWGE